MSSLKDLLASSQDWTRSLKIKAPEVLHLPKACAKLAGEGVLQNAEKTEALQLRIRTLLTDNPMVQFSGRDLRDICRVILHAPTPPGRDPFQRSAIIAAIELKKRRSALFALIDAYLDAFKLDDEALSYFAGELQRLCHEWPWREGDVWPQRQQAFHIFNPDVAPKAIGRLVMAARVPPMRALDSTGLDTPGRRKGGLAEAAFRMACQDIMGLVGTPAIGPQTQAIDWAFPDSEGFYYPRAWPVFAGALFLPWKSSPPEELHQIKLIDAACRYAGDPRTNPSRWQVVREQAPEAHDTILRWLTKASFEQFFAIVDQMTDRPDMWAERKRFWKRYLDRSLISGAWVVFGSDGASLATRVAQNTDNAAMMKFGRLSSGEGRTPQHTALIMQIGDLTIAEWSHNGRWNIWRRSDKNPPSLYRYNSARRPDYRPGELMGGPISGSHDAHGGWKYTVDNHIQNETGIRL